MPNNDRDAVEPGWRERATEEQAAHQIYLAKLEEKDAELAAHLKERREARIRAAKEAEARRRT